MFEPVRWGMPQSINEIAEEIHDIAVDHGWYNDAVTGEWIE